MARPERKDADYFPFICKDGRTLFILEAKYQCKGTGFFTNVMRFLTMQPDHHICIKEETDKLFFFSRTKCDEESGLDMLGIMSKTGKIHPALWAIHSVIVSQDLLDSLVDAYKNRKNPIITIDEILVSYPINPVSCQDNPQEPVVTYLDNPQRKGKETKLKKSKETYTSDFLSFWECYPKKVGRDAAWRVWQKRNGDRPDITTIISAVELQKTCEQWCKDNGQFIPHAATWLNQGRWADQVLNKQERMVRI